MGLFACTEQLPSRPTSAEERRRDGASSSVRWRRGFSNRSRYRAFHHARRVSSLAASRRRRSVLKYCATSYAGEDCPKTVFPTSYATVPPVEATTAATEDPRLPTYYHGQHLNLYRPHAVHSNFIHDGLVTDWDALERNLDYAFRDRMRLDTLADYPLLVTEASWNTKDNREKMCEIAFEKLDVPAYYAVDKAVMSAFASSRGSALVLDVGEEMTSLVPIYDGFVLRKGSSLSPSSLVLPLTPSVPLAIQKQPTGGNLLSSILLKQIKAQSPPIEIVPHYLVKSKQPVEPLTPAQAQLRFVASSRFSLHQRFLTMSDTGRNACPTRTPWIARRQLRIITRKKWGSCTNSRNRLAKSCRAYGMISRSFHFIFINPEADIESISTGLCKIDRRDRLSFLMVTTPTLVRCERRRRKFCSIPNDSSLPKYFPSLYQSDPN